MKYSNQDFEQADQELRAERKCGSSLWEVVNRAEQIAEKRYQQLVRENEKLRAQLQMAHEKIRQLMDDSQRYQQQLERDRFHSR